MKISFLFMAVSTLTSAASAFAQTPSCSPGYVFNNQYKRCMTPDGACNEGWRLSADGKICERGQAPIPGGGGPQSECSFASLCYEGLGFIVANQYQYKAGEKPTTWIEKWGEFESKYKSACEVVGKRLVIKRDKPDFLNQREGIYFHVQRIPSYCPGLHLSQYDCVQGGVRISANANAFRDAIKAEWNLSADGKCASAPVPIRRGAPNIPCYRGYVFNEEQGRCMTPDGKCEQGWKLNAKGECELSK